ncbi:MAG: ATPase, T2SS/T4P/T4SS family [Planctomycetota bacterium]
MAENRLGAILLEGGVVDEPSLERCVAIQALTGGNVPIGKILVEQGLLDSETLERLLALQQVRAEQRVAEVAPSDLASRSIVAAAIANGASELLVSEEQPARIRTGSGWEVLTDVGLSSREVWEFVRELMGSDVLEALADEKFVVRPWIIDGLARGASSAVRHFDGVAVRLTFAPMQIDQPEDVGVPKAVVDAVDAGRGLILCVGERGVGRSEMLASLTRRAARVDGQYVVVVDDESMPLPEEEEGGALVVRRRYGIDPTLRARSLRSAVQEDPDVLVVADVGDPASFELALRAADSGRLVIAYLDAGSVGSALARILNFYPSYELPRVQATLAATLRTVLVRHLLPGPDRRSFVPATELLIGHEGVREALRDGRLGDLALLMRSEDGSSGHTLDRSMLELMREERVSIEDAFARAVEKAWLLERSRNLAGNEAGGDPEVEARGQI